MSAKRVAREWAVVMKPDRLTLCGMVTDPPPVVGSRILSMTAPTSGCSGGGRAQHAKVISVLSRSPVR